MQDREVIPGFIPLERVKVIGRREGGLIEAYVPIELIYRQDVPVDLDHVKELANAIEKERELSGGARTGQLSPVLIAEIPSFNQFPIIDGFHRVPALDLLGSSEVYSTIRPDSSWEEVVDLRILAATTHRAVRFSRLIEWIDESWNFSPWQDKIRVSQAFQLRFTSAMTGSRLGLDVRDVEDIKTWVDQKCSQWQISPSYLYQQLTVANVADPDLVKEARERRQGRRLDAITPLHLSAIAKTLPNRYDFQRLVASEAKAKVLTVPQTRAVAVSITSAQSLEEATKLIERGAWRSLEAVYSPSRQREIRRQQREFKDTKSWNLEYERLLGEFFDDEIQIAQLSIENAVFSGRYSRLLEEEKNKIVDSGVEIVEDLVESDPLTVNFDPEVVQRIYERQGVVVHSLISKYGIRSVDAEDFFSDVVMKTLVSMKKGIFQYSSDPELEAWLFKLAYQTVADHFKGSGREIVSSDAIKRFESDNLEFLNPLIEENPDIETVDQEYKSLIMSALPFVSKESRRTFVLREFFYLPVRDIAQITGKEANNVKVLLFKARQSIAKVLF